MSKSRQPQLDETGLHAATAAVLDSRGFTYAASPEEGQDAFDITMQVRDEVRTAVSTYMLASAPLPGKTEEILVKLDDIVFGGRYGEWERNADLLDVIAAMDIIRFLASREKARRIDPLPLPELAALVEEKLKPLSGLYNKTKRDWFLEVSHILTEPTCPTAVIAAEDSNSLRYAVHRDTVVEAIFAAADLACREMILGEEIRPECPVTNPDDREP